MDILKFPHALLLTPTKNVTVFGEELKFLLDEMWDTLQEHKAVGLAANQVGLPWRMFVMEGPEGRLNLVNPVIIAKSRAFANLSEGCLSAPGDFVTVPDRADWVQISYENEKGEEKTLLLKGMHAVCAQHEIDHLDGISFMEHKSIPKSIRNGLMKRWGVE